MTFDEVLDQVRELLQSRGRVAYRALKRRFEIDDEYLEDLKAELIDAEHVACDEDGKVLVWMGKGENGETAGEKAKGGKGEKEKDAGLRTSDTRPSDGERRQLTVMFIDLVGSTTLSQQLDPEDYHARVVTYQTACQQIIARYEGHITQYLGDGVLVYFGYPVAHEDDATRAVRAGLEIISAIQRFSFPSPLAGEGQGEGVARKTLQVRIGIHTGPVVVGEIGAGERTERLALGETPNIAARVQSQAEPDTVVMSAATYHLVQGLFECHDLGLQTLKGISTPLSLYRIISESAAQSRFEVAMRSGLTPFVGREAELGLLRQCWEQASVGNGQVVLLNGEPGIGKSRLTQEFKEQLGRDGVTRLEFRCSPYHQNSALYPIIDHLQRLLQFTGEDSPTTKLEKLQHTLSRYRFPQADTLPLLAALLSLPHPTNYPPITVSPQKQKEKTQAALVAWLVEEVAQKPVYNAWEDLHWADPSTLEVLTLLLDQVPTTRLLAVLTFRPEFTPPWGNRSHLSQIILRRLGRPHVETMVEKVTHGKALPPEVLQQIVSKTDGVPLFVEELTKSLVEAEQAVGATGRSSLPTLGIPATLQDALMARLDRLGTAKDLAQLSAIIGREFSYELLQAVSLLDETTLQRGLKQLVEVELLYQRGLPPQATYLFKHALIQDTAYQSLLKSKRQQYHQQIAKVLETQFPETKETQPELVAHHYTEARLAEQAIPYWQQAGQKAIEHSAHVEAIGHLAKGIELIKTLPDIADRSQQEFSLQISLGGALMATKGWAAPEVEQAYSRAQELCQQLGETPQLFPALWGLCLFHSGRGELQKARELGEQLLSLAQSVQDSALLIEAHHLLWAIALWLGELSVVREHCEQAISLYDPRQHRSLAFHYGGHDPGACCRGFVAWALWLLGYPDQALMRSREALTLAHNLSHPMSVGSALDCIAIIHQLRREGQAAQKLADAGIEVATEQGFPFFLIWGIILRGWALATQGQVDEGIVQISQGLDAYRTTGWEEAQSYFLALQAETYGKLGQAEEGLTTLAEALAIINKTGERFYEAELYRLKGELTLQSKVQDLESKIQEAEQCFHKAIEIARKQQAKSLELRAVMSLVRFRQYQAQDHIIRNTQHVLHPTQHETRAKLAEAHRMLSEVYNWFTEGFDTLDLKEAKALLEELSH